MSKRKKIGFDISCKLSGKNKKKKKIEDNLHELSNRF